MSNSHIEYNKIIDIVNKQSRSPQNVSTESTTTSSSFNEDDGTDNSVNFFIKNEVQDKTEIEKYIQALDSIKSIVERQQFHETIDDSFQNPTSSRVSSFSTDLGERKVSIVCADQIKGITNHRRISDEIDMNLGQPFLSNSTNKYMEFKLKSNNNNNSTSAHHHNHSHNHHHHHRTKRHQGSELYSTENGKHAENFIVQRERLSKRNEKIIVEIRVVFLKIGEIDTLKELYHADAFIQSKWREPRLDGKTAEELSQIDLQECWNPLIFIENILTESKEQHWILAQMDENNQTWVVERRRLRGVFLETLELNDFPLDVQDLTITLTSERPDTEIDLVPDASELCGINVQTFIDQQEWRLHEHIEISRQSVVQEYTSSSQSHPCISVTCRAARRPGYFYWNVFLIMFFITGLSFATFAVPADRPENRLQLSFTLFLTSVAFKFVINQSLPKISYLTYMDKYVLMSLGILCVISIWHASVTLIPVVAETRIKNILGLDEYRLNDNRTEILKLFNIAEEDIPMNNSLFNLSDQEKKLLNLSNESSDEFINWAKMTNKIRVLTKKNEERIKSIELNVFGSFCVLYIIAHFIFVFWLYYDASKRRREMFEKDRQYKLWIAKRTGTLLNKALDEEAKEIIQRRC